MKHFFLIVALLFVAQWNINGQELRDSNWSKEVGIVTLERDGIALEEAVLTMEGEERLMLAFDLLDPQPQTLRYQITHCDAHWRKDELEPYEYYIGFSEAPIDNYASSFTTLQPYVHYYQEFPGQFEKFLISGNYVVSVYRDNEILLTRRFYVQEGTAKATIEAGRTKSGGRLMEDQEVDVAIEGTYRPEYLTVVVQQNGRTDNSRELSFSGYERGMLCYRWKSENIFPGGNSFRYFDISNLRTPMYNVQRIEQFGGEHFALLKPEEDRSQKSFSSGQSLNGGLKVNVWDRNEVNTEADYVWVNFSLPMERPILGGTIHIVGALTQWQSNEMSRMDWNPSFKAYTKRLYLKQGYYAYQLLYLPNGESKGETGLIEGDHVETANDYTLYVYYREPGGRYDRLLRVTTIKH